MNSNCENIKDQIADLVTGILTEAQAQKLQQHLNECAACRDYARALKNEDALLTEFVEQMDKDMTRRQERLLQTIDRSYQSPKIEIHSIWRMMIKHPIGKIAIAAVLLFGLFISSRYLINDEIPTITAEHYIPSRGQVEELEIAFTHIRELFGEQCPWMVLDSSGKGEIGVDNLVAQKAEADKVIVVRLVVNTQDNNRYYDVVALSHQELCFSIPTTDNHTIDIFLRPVITSNNSLAIEIKTSHGNGLQTGGTATIVGNRFTSLVRVKSNSQWINIDAVGQPVHNI